MINITTVCLGCTKEFTITTHDKRRNPKYCTKECFRKSTRGETRLCEFCGNTIYKRKSELKEHRKSFCSRICANKWQTAHAHLNKTTIVCKFCKEKFTVYKSTVKWDNRKYCSVKCRNLDPDRHQQLINMNVAQQKMKGYTKPEKIGYSILDDLKLIYYPQQVMVDKFCVDAYLPEYELIIQFDGDYWHGNPDKFTILDQRQTKRKNLDTSQDAYLIKCGYKIIRIWEHELLKTPDFVRDRIQATLNNLSNTICLE